MKTKIPTDNGEYWYYPVGSEPFMGPGPQKARVVWEEGDGEGAWVRINMVYHRLALYSKEEKQLPGDWEYIGPLVNPLDEERDNDGE